MKGRRRRHGRLCILPVLLCIVVSFSMGAWYERQYGNQEQAYTRVAYAPVFRGGPRIEEPAQWDTYIATAYCPCKNCCGSGASGITASGARPREGVTIAADWDILPEGTIVEIQDIGYRMVQDTGSAIKGHRIDIYFEEHEKALEFGVRKVQVRKVLGGGR